MVIKMDFDAILSEILTYGDLEEIEEEDASFSELKYPKLLPMMRMYPKRYALRDFGQVFTMKTKGPMGMELLTISFCPGEGCEVPFLLIDCMKVGKKRTVFVEYYDCTAEKPEREELCAVWERYKDLPDYDEKPHWYVSERAPYSLIKGCEGRDEELGAMVLESAGVYLGAVLEAKKSDKNLPGLRAFRERMIREGNPSSDILNKTLGKAGSEKFFKEWIMKIGD